MNVSRKLKIALLTVGIIGLFELPIPVVHNFVTTAKAAIVQYLAQHKLESQALCLEG